MKRPPEKELYSIIGVDPDASPEKIRYAYLARTRVIHPDRFDQQRQPLNWKKANEMLAELNEAYSILRDPSSREEYDQIRSGKQQRHTALPRPGPQPPPVFERGELTPGHASFGSLPKDIQARLLKRQENKEVDQFQIKLTSVVWNYVFIAVLLCWFWYLFADADGAKWKEDTLLWYAGFTLVAGLLIGRNLVIIIQWTRVTLKPYFYVTPIYFIKTEYDIVSFRPIWTLKDVAITHNYKNGSYQDSDVVLKFDGHNESLTLSSKQDVDTMFERIRRYDAWLRTAYANHDYDYFRNNDDFFQTPRSNVPTTVLLSKWKRTFTYITSVLLCGMGFYAAIAINEDLSQKRWVRHPVPPSYTPTPVPQRVASPSYPEQPMPYSGNVRTYTTAERVAPFEIKAAQGSNYLVKLVDAYTYASVLTVFVRSGTTVKVDVPLGSYEVRYASGESWYGHEYFFGPDTAYSKADKTFTFEIIGNQISGFTITLYKVAHGNLHTSSIRPTEF